MAKHFAHALALTLGCIATLAPASSVEAQDRAITTEPLELAHGSFNFEYEGVLVPFVSFHMGLDFLTFDGFDEDDGDLFAVGPQMGLRLYPFMGAPSGFWINPFVGVTYVRGETQLGESVEDLGGYAGGMIGATIIPFDILVLSAGVGAAYHEIGMEADFGDIGDTGLHPRVRLALGIAF